MMGKLAGNGLVFGQEPWVTADFPNRTNPIICQIRSIPLYHLREGPQTGRIGAGGGKGRAVAKFGDPIKTKGFSYFPHEKYLFSFSKRVSYRSNFGRNPYFRSS